MPQRGGPRTRSWQDACSEDACREARRSSRLSFRSKLLLVLFVPFLALVVVAAAGLERPVHRAARAGAVRRPLGSAALARRRQRARSRTRASCQSWYVEHQPRRADPIEQAARRGPTPRSTQFRADEQAFRNAGHRRRRASPRSTPPTPASTQIADERDAGRARRPSTSSTPPLLLLAVDDNLLDFGEGSRATCTTRADGVASLTGVFALERAQTRARARGDRRCIAGARRAATPSDFSEWVARHRRRGALPSAVPRHRDRRRARRLSTVA